MFASIAQALRADAEHIQREINFARQLFALQSGDQLTLLSSGSPSSAEVDEAYRDMLTVEFGRWQS